MLGAIHGILALVALVLGAVILLSPKGASVHVALGWAYVASMAGLNVSALFIYRLTGHFNFFHALAIASLFMVAGGVLQVRFRSRFRNWLWRHYQYMSWSFVGLVAAANNEAFVRVHALKGLAAHTTQTLPLLVSLLILIASAVIIFYKQPSVLSRYGSR